MEYRGHTVESDRIIIDLGDENLLLVATTKELSDDEIRELADQYITSLNSPPPPIPGDIP